MLNEKTAYDLVKKSGVVLKNGKLVVPQNAPAEILKEIRDNKDDIVEYLSGYCFSFQSAFMCKPTEWVVLQVSAIADVSYSEKEIFSGSAYEVDTWCKQHKNNPLFTDKYTSKYTICHR